MGFILPTYNLDVMCNDFCWKCKSEKEHLFMLFGNLNKCIPFGKRKSRSCSGLVKFNRCFYSHKNNPKSMEKHILPKFQKLDRNCVRNWIIQKMLARVDYDTENFMRCLRGQFVEMVVGRLESQAQPFIVFLFLSQFSSTLSLHRDVVMISAFMENQIMTPSVLAKQKKQKFQERLS